MKSIRKLSEGDAVRVIFCGPYGDGELSWVIGGNISLEEAEKYYDYQHDQLYLVINATSPFEQPSMSLMSADGWKKFRRSLPC